MNSGFTVVVAYPEADGAPGFRYLYMFERGAKTPDDALRAVKRCVAANPGHYRKENGDPIELSSATFHTVPGMAIVSPMQ